MTHNQIEYWKYVETQRANRAQEAVNTSKLLEESRHNLANEQKDWIAQREVQRSNIAKEGETQRSNIAKEGETQRANMVKEAETERHNMANETLDLLALAETERTHRANEGIGYSNVSLGYANVALGREQLAEQQRHNEILEGVSQQEADIKQQEADTHETATQNQGKHWETEERLRAKELAQQGARYNVQNQADQINSTANFFNSVFNGVKVLKPIALPGLE